MAAKRHRKSTKRRKSSKRRKTKTGKHSKASESFFGKRKPKKRRRTAAQKAATARMLAANKAKRSGHHSLPALPAQFRRGASIHTQPTYRPRTVHQPTRVMHHISHDFED